jgi:hypothetical protein
MKRPEMKNSQITADERRQTNPIALPNESEKTQSKWVINRSPKT